MTIAHSAAGLPASGAGGCLREGVARRPWMAGGMGTDGSRLTLSVYLSNQQPDLQSVPIVGLKPPRRSIKVEMAGSATHGG
jgi:hypothetical protein